ncbi:hypothetical protein RIR_jg11069.t1 [Rhizophagus irregularis DAOM 181602=DAOM 197198]|uniref:Uncharacterized protein n=1 Tax=Rhizophagus irregularis (strain DAOM 181602 / DAOM 197198 / MUCL 43194) TaxID=747089 RepID=U9TN61_RHIID|nr:hypothetical protein RIR_jg11069.t1 [Rhizophagus irregularis DAOM 181602=DAOM 197198]
MAFLIHARQYLVSRPELADHHHTLPFFCITYTPSLRIVYPNYWHRMYVKISMMIIPWILHVNSADHDG